MKVIIKKIGEINLKYLLSFGQIDEPFFSKYRYSTLYWTVLSFINQMFPQKFYLEVYHLLNSFFGLMTIVEAFTNLLKFYSINLLQKISSVFLFSYSLFLWTLRYKF